MTQTEMPQKIEHLKRFLITRLLLVMAFILVSESLINLFVGQIAFPALNTFFRAELFLEKQSSGTNVFLLVRLVINFILEEIEGILPVSFPSLSRSIWKNSGLLGKISSMQQILMLVVLFLFLCIYSLPYILGVLYYSSIVIKKMEEVREYDRKQREAFAKKRNLLLSDITHDLKTPITTIAGYVQALNDGMVKDAEKQKQYLTAIRQKSLEMSDLITLLFNYVKLDSEGFDLKKERVNITELVLQIAAGAYTDIEDAGMEFDVEIPEEAGYVEVDKAQFTRALTNLITNAVKHNSPGTKIKISMKHKFGYWVIKVMDSGENIDESLMENLFDPFVMGDESRNSHGGSGLGLSVSKKVIDMHGGKLLLEQPTEEGYTKAFCIRMKQMEDSVYEYDN
ncbi:MAG: sensor histidine kinase [Muricoprocola sp.]